MTKDEKVQEILKRLYKIWPEPKTELTHKNAFELLVATILSAQCTDKVINTLTPALFVKYPTPEKMSQATDVEIDAFITKATFHKTKAKNILATAKLLVEKFHSEVPKTITEITTLPGAARKTANVVLGNFYGIGEGIVVDTHVRRLSNAFGLTTEQDPVKIEQDLMKIVPKDKWIDFANLLVLFGRYKCTARMNPEDDPTLGDLAV